MNEHKIGDRRERDNSGGHKDGFHRGMYFEWWDGREWTTRNPADFEVGACRMTKEYPYYEWWTENGWFSPDRDGDEPIRVILARMENKLNRLRERVDIIGSRVSGKRPMFSVPIRPPADDDAPYNHIEDWEISRFPFEPIP